MDSVRIRLLPYEIADGAHNMAADELLLENAAAGGAALRFYGWSEPTLSLGYFQAEAARHTANALASLPYVRRPTGGMTLVHHHELTYALALPAGPPWQMPRERTQPWLCRMHTVLGKALEVCGVSLTAAACDGAPKRPDVLCFRHVTAGDLLAGDLKVVGSAQRKQRGALLQHGAILLAASPFTPSLPGIQELSGRRPELDALQTAVITAFRADTGWQADLHDWSKKERLRIEELVRSKYAQSSWNARR